MSLHKGLEILQTGPSPRRVLELHLGSGHQPTPLPQTLLTSLKREQPPYSFLCSEQSQSSVLNAITALLIPLPPLRV